MDESIRGCINKAMNRCERLVISENLFDAGIDTSSQQMILRMARGTQRNRIDALGILAALKLGYLDEIQGNDENAISEAFRDFRGRFNQGVAIAASGLNPWMCALVCAACAAAILDGVPGDEVVACALCVNLCSRSA